ncbi:MAG: sensor domain-containing diguanylate cyclase [Thermodesulfobacteriota bacterium]
MHKREITSKSPADLAVFSDWAGCIMAIIGALALGSGALFQDSTPSLNGMIVALMLTLATGHYYWRFQIIKPANEQSRSVELEGPLLLIVISWTLFRLGQSSLPSLIIIPAMTIAWITIRYYGLTALICVLAGVAVEAGLTLTGNQTLLLASTNIVFCAIVVASLNFFPGAKLYKTKLRQARIATDLDIATREQTMEMGLDGDNISASEILQNLHNIDPTNSFSRQTVESVNKSFELQLEMVRLALKLTTIAVLWPDPANDVLRLRYLATTREDINPGPYPAGIGITGALLGDREETELVGVKPSHPALPYYRKQEGVGSIMALRIPTNQPGSEKTETAKTGILCADRESDSPWSDRERQVLRLTGKKLGLEISGCRLLLNMDRERATINRLCHGLRELNSDPKLDSIFAASIKAVKAQVQTDLLALCLRIGDRHQTVLAEGAGADKLTDQSFPIEEGLVGQAIKTARTLPAGGRYLGAAPIFSSGQTFRDYQSLLVVPLPDEDDTPIGCLVAAAKAPGIFTKNRQEILEIIAAQISTNIKLGQAHEQLGVQATTDGLTGLVNHQTFQHGCEVMLERAKRNDNPLCLLMADLDHFKKINDSFGHPFGDLVLREVAKVLAETIRTVDLAARYGGEEFALVLENCDGQSGLILAEKIRERIAQLHLICGDKTITVTLSIGIAAFPKDSSDKSNLIELADQALYRAKGAGRNQAALWSEPPD